MLTMMQALPMNCVWDEIITPVGTLILIASDTALHAVLWKKELNDREFQYLLSNLKKSNKQSIINDTQNQLREYFLKKRKYFDIPISFEGTSFQKNAWTQLTKIPYGKTISYSCQAKQMGDAKKARAVGGANGKNPISIIVPCHRVIGKNGTLTGFGGGLDNKKYLLELENG